MSRFSFLIALLLISFPSMSVAQTEIPTYCVRGLVTSPIEGPWSLVDGSGAVEVDQGTAIFKYQIQFYAEPPPSTKVGRADFSAELVNRKDVLVVRDSVRQIFVDQIRTDQSEIPLKGERFRCNCADRFFAEEKNITFRFMFGHLFSMNFFGYAWNSPDANQEYRDYHGQTLPEKGDLYSATAQVNPGACNYSEWIKP